MKKSFSKVGYFSKTAETDQSAHQKYKTHLSVYSSWVIKLRGHNPNHFSLVWDMNLKSRIELKNKDFCVLLCYVLS